MERIVGKGVCDGVAIGRICFFHHHRGAKRYEVAEAWPELLRLEQALKRTRQELMTLHQKAVSEVGEREAAVFEAHQMILEDEEYIGFIRSEITAQKLNAEYAVDIAGDRFSRMVAEMDDLYLRERSVDVRDVSDRVIHCLTGEAEEIVDCEGGVIMIADDLSPSETIRFDKSKILAFVTARGSANSHTAILAKTLGIPAIVGAGGICGFMDGKLGIVDGGRGELVIEPDRLALEAARARMQEEQDQKECLEEYRGKPNQTKDGIGIQIHANIGNQTDLRLALENDAGGVGLFRTEFLYFESMNDPTEEELYVAFRTAAEAMAGKRVIIRTLDLGADKQLDYIRLKKEENPALGMRGIRISLARPELLRVQLRAVYRASAFGKVAILLPMVTSLWEVQRAKEIARDVREELRTRNILISSEVELGVMIETPAAALISDLLAPEVDFFSIGTNDLTQYTLAADRQNPDLEPYCDTHHEAVLRLIQMVVDHARQNHIWVGICGELAADLTLMERFLRMGVDELSVSPSAVLKLRRHLSTLCLHETGI
jgi:phosphotransferase system enzyme I (PtsI)